jgi:putative Holliday junction resolvase
VSEESGRVMALDVGGRRIGVAISDTARLLASPLTTIRAEPRATALTQIATLIARHDVVDLVVGLPLTLRGEIGPQAQVVQAFVEELRKSLTVPIHLVDERLTSVEAERMMIELGVKREQRRARIDEVAASLILRDFLTARNQQSGVTD